MKHTKGPWTLTDDGRAFEIPEIRWYFLHDHSTDEKTDKELREKDGFKCQLANARLIAAGPDLLEACKLMYEAWKQLLPNLKNGVVQDYELVCTNAPLACRQAIAKAEGRE